MRSKRSRLDRFLCARAGIEPRQIRPLLASGAVQVDGVAATGISQVINEFSRIQLNDRVLQDRRAVYFMLHKPPGVVSATRDAQHKTVIDLLTRADREGLHIAGRLDYNSSGLLLLTNDGRWSRRLSSPTSAVQKRYRVGLENRITADCIAAFAEGMFFAYEGITTLPAELHLIDDRTAEVVLVEGKYHQIKRMFGRFRNRVLSLHRVAIGQLTLDDTLPAGHYRTLTRSEHQDIDLPQTTA